MFVIPLLPACPEAGLGGQGGLKPQQLTFSTCITCSRREVTSMSLSRVYLTMAQRDWMGSMILVEVLQASAKRVVLL